MRHEKLYLADIVEAAKAIDGFVSGITREQFLENDLLRSGVLYKLTIIGEAASKLSKEIKNKYPDMEWAKIVAFRNIAIHAYFSVDWKIAWNAATLNVPLLKEKIKAILDAEFPA